jgi:hypothetical protein
MHTVFIVNLVTRENNSKDLQKGIKFCRMYGILSDQHFKDELSDKTILHYLGFCREVFFIVCM